MHIGNAYIVSLPGLEKKGVVEGEKKEDILSIE